MSVFKPGLFSGKVAIVTGGGTGIGKAISEELLTLGAKVVIASRNEDKVAGAAKEMGKLGEVAPLKCNIRSETEVKNLVSTTLEKFGRLDFLVNNGGVHRQYMSEHGGVIVNIIADMFRGFPMMAHTGAARAGVENLSRSLAVEWAGDGIRVNAVAPGVVFSTSAKANYDVDILGGSIPGIPAQRLGVPQEVSSAVCFLLSPGASFISGATLRVDAGGSLYSPQLWQIDEHNKLPAYSWDPYEGVPSSKL